MLFSPSYTHLTWMVTHMPAVTGSRGFPFCLPCWRWFCAAPYNLLVRALVRWHPTVPPCTLSCGSFCHCTLYCQTPVGAQPALCMRWGGWQGHDGNKVTSAHVRHSLTAALSAFPLPGLSLQSHIFITLVDLVKLTFWLFVESLVTSCLLFHPSDSCSMKLRHCYISSLKLPGFEQTPSPAALFRCFLLGIPFAFTSHIWCFLVLHRLYYQGTHVWIPPEGRNGISI